MEYPFVIIDNDTSAISAIQLSFENYNNFICVGVARNEQTGLDLILERRPSLVFLNIELPGSSTAKTMFYMMNELRKYIDVLPEFVVLAKSPKYAIDSIRNSVLDYMLKPLDMSVLRRCLFRFQQRVKTQVSGTLCFKSYGDYKFVNTSDILYLKADNNTTDVVMTNDRVVRAFKTLKSFQDSLPEHFVRIHNSYIVNVNHISRIHFGKSKCTVKNSSHTAVPFSKSYRSNVELIRDSLSKNSLMIA